MVPCLPAGRNSIWEHNLPLRQMTLKLYNNLTLFTPIAMGLLKKIKQKKIGSASLETSMSDTENWLENQDYQEGQLAIDVFQDENSLTIKSTIAGVKPEDIDISINHDMLTIRGHRQELKKIAEENYLYRECYWGSFSRSLILPFEVKIDRIEAELENGILTITLPKAKTKPEVLIKVKAK
jgi:HSP20 family protein